MRTAHVPDSEGIEPTERSSLGETSRTWSKSKTEELLLAKNELYNSGEVMSLNSLKIIINYPLTRSCTVHLQLLPLPSGEGRGEG